MEFTKRAIENAEQATKSNVTGSWMIVKFVGLAIAWAVIEIADTLRDKSTYVMTGSEPTFDPASIEKVSKALDTAKEEEDEDDSE